jgi:hypothetical protein
MIFRTPNRAGKLAGKMRLASSGLGRRNPMQRQADFMLEDKVVMQARLIVGGKSHDQRTLVAELDVDAG